MEDIKQKEVEEKSTKKRVFFILKIVGNVIFYSIILILFIFAIMNIRAGKQSFPNIFGMGFLSVQSNSMERDDVEENDPKEWKDYEIAGFRKGDLVLSKTHSGDASDLKVGDIITWYDEAIKALNTHRIVYISDDKSYVIAQGDNVAQRMPFNKTDPFSTYNYSLESTGNVQHVTSSQILGKATGVWNGAGSVLDNLQKNWLFYFVIPVAVLLLIELFFVFKNILDYRGEKKKLEAGNINKEAMRAELEAEKAKMREELLKELAERGVITNTPAEAPKEEPANEEQVSENPTEEAKPEENVSEETPVDAKADEANTEASTEDVKPNEDK